MSQSFEGEEGPSARGVDGSTQEEGVPAELTRPKERGLPLSAVAFEAPHRLRIVPGESEETKAKRVVLLASSNMRNNSTGIWNAQEGSFFFFRLGRGLSFVIA